MPERRKCSVCCKLSRNWTRRNGGPWHCFDGCYSTTGLDRRSADGYPSWIKTFKVRTVDKDGYISIDRRKYRADRPSNFRGLFGISQMCQGKAYCRDE